MLSHRAEEIRANTPFDLLILIPLSHPFERFLYEAHSLLSRNIKFTDARDMREYDREGFGTKIKTNLLNFMTFNAVLEKTKNKNSQNWTRKGVIFVKFWTSDCDLSNSRRRNHILTLIPINFI